MKEYVSPTNRDRLLRAGLIKGNFNLASGMTSRIKYDIDFVQGELFDVVVDGIADCVADHFDEEDFNTVFTVATGANALGDPVVDALRYRHRIHAHHVPSRKDGVGDFYLPPIHEPGVRGVIIDDVYSTGKSMRAVKVEVERKHERWAPEKRRIGGKVIGAIALLNRSSEKFPQLSHGVPVYSVINEDLTKFL